MKASRQRRRNLLRSLDNSVVTDDMDRDEFLQSIHQIHGELCELDEVVSTECLTTVILDALPAKKDPS